MQHYDEKKINAIQKEIGNINGMNGKGNMGAKTKVILGYKNQYYLSLSTISTDYKMWLIGMRVKKKQHILKCFPSKLPPDTRVVLIYL